MVDFPPQILEYAKKARAAGHTDDMIRQNLTTAGWHKEQLDALFVALQKDTTNVPAVPATQPKSTSNQTVKAESQEPKKKPKKKHRGLLIGLCVAIVLLLLAGGAAAYFYFFVVSPLNGKILDVDVARVEADIEDLRLGILFRQDFTIRPEHVTYLFWKIDGHKIHPDPFSGEIAETESVVSNGQQKFLSKNEGDGLRTIQGSSQDPDVRFTIDKGSFIDILIAENHADAVRTKVNAGEVLVEILKGEEVLALKGYKGIYDAIT